MGCDFSIYYNFLINNWFLILNKLNLTLLKIKLYLLQNYVRTWKLEKNKWTVKQKSLVAIKRNGIACFNQLETSPEN